MRIGKEQIDMHREDRLYLQLIIGIGIGIVLGLAAFSLVTSCSIGTLCSIVDAAAEGALETRLSVHEKRR